MAISALAFVLGAAGLLLMPAAGLAYRTGTLPLQSVLQPGMRYAAYLGIAAIVVGLIGAAFSYRRRAHRGTAVAAAGIVLGLLAFWIPYNWQQTARSVPPIHDISTDTVDPPVFEAVVPLRANAPNSLEYLEEVAAQQRQAYPDVVPVTLAMPPDRAFEQALAAARGAGWEIVDADPQAGRIEATDTTRWFGFKDDVVIRLRPADGGTRLDIRSVSRVGRSDVGTNARRIRAYLAAVQRG